MSTRATIHFKWRRDGGPEAVIYRHSDGYPDGLGEDLKEFIGEVELQCGDDTRFSDPPYLAAKWVVWDGLTHAKATGGEKAADKLNPANPLRFLSVGVVSEDPGDIEFRYTVICDGTPRVYCRKVGWNDEPDGPAWEIYPNAEPPPDSDE